LGVNLDDQLADEAEEHLGQLLVNCRESGYTPQSIEAVWAGFGTWVAHPVFAQYPGMLRCSVLNELTFCLSDENLADGAWRLLGDLAERWERYSLGSLMDAIRISTFELIAEAPAIEADLRRLFAMAGNPCRRWVVFAAYQNVPWRLRPHARKYSDGLITDDDCDEWLRDQDHGEDEVLMSRD
jgi:hypothetical protein